MEINWSMLGNAPNAGQAFLQGMEQGQQRRKEAQLDNALRYLGQNPGDQNALNQIMSVDPRLGLQMRQYAAQQADRDAARSAGKLYASGDRTGARNAAIGSGNFELASQFLALDEAGQKREAAKYQAAAPVLMRAKSVPYEQRRQLIAAAAPALTAQGWAPDEIANFDPTDEAVDGLTAAAMTVDQVLKSGEVKWVTGDWGAFATDSRGRPMAPGFSGQPTPAAPQPAQPQPNQAPVGDTNSFRSPVYDQMEGPIEQQLGLPPGLIAAIRTKGEQSNADQVSSARARTVYQITPETRELFLRKYGVDAYAGPQQAATVAGLHLKESLERGGDVTRAIREYHGGPDERNWGPVNRAYVDRVTGGAQFASNDAPPQQPGQAPFASDIQSQAASGVIRPGQKPPPGYREGPNGTLQAIPGGPGDKTNDNNINLRKEAAQVRQEFMGLPLVKKFNDVRNSTLQIQELARSVPDMDPGRAQADMALIFSFMKALDPGSTVREGEFATAQNAAGIPERIRNYFNAAQNGQKLSPEQRMGMVRAAEDVYRTTARTYNEVARQYHPIFKELGVSNPSAFAPIAVEGDRKQPPRQPAPKPNQNNGRPRIRVISRRKVS